MGHLRTMIDNLGKLVVTFELPIWYYITMPAVLAKSNANNFRGMHCSGAKKCLSMFFRVYFVWRTFYGRIPRFSLRYPTGTLWIASYVSPIFHLQSLSKEDGFSNYSLLLLFSSLASRKKFHWFVTNRSDLGIGKVYDNDATKYRLRCSTH